MTTASIVFKIANTTVLPAWLLLIFFPKHRITAKFITSGFITLALSVLYTMTIIIHFLNSPLGGFDSLESVRLLFSRDWALLAGWVHYLAFDLYIGAIIINERDDKFAFRFIIAFFTFMFGPIGFLFSKILPKNTK